MNTDVNFVISNLEQYVKAHRFNTTSPERDLLNQTNKAINKSLGTNQRSNNFLLSMYASTNIPLCGAYADEHYAHTALYKKFQGGSRDGIPVIDHGKVIHILNLLEREGISEESQRLFLALLQEQFSNLVLADKTTDKDGSVEPAPSPNFSAEEIRFHLDRGERLETEIPELVKRVDLSTLKASTQKQTSRFKH